ncbi:MAG: aldo/keto reductase [Pirellulales bacterium]
MMYHRPFGRTGLSVPPIVFGATNLGNLFRALEDETKREIVREWIRAVPAPIVIDSAGKYGAGLSLEVIGRELEAANVPEANVIISNKLAWRRVPLTTPEPTFEPGAWIDIHHDARQDISYDGILRCWKEGNELLGNYQASLLSVHDPDEYLAAASDASDRKRRFQDIVDAYRALAELKQAGLAAGIGIGSKTWSVIRELDPYCPFDWVMFANSFTVMNHPSELVQFMENLHQRDIAIINSAVFQGGFLVGGDFYNYKKISLELPEDVERLRWRERFWEICKRHGEDPFSVAVAFGRSHPAITSIALSSSRPDRIASHVASVTHQVSPDVWNEMRSAALIDPHYPYLAR